MSCGVTWPTAHPRFLIRDGEGPCVCTVFVLNNALGRAGIQQLQHQNLGMAQVKSGADTSAYMAYKPHSMYMSVLVMGYPKTTDGLAAGILPWILILEGRQDAVKNNMRINCFPVGIAKDRFFWRTMYL